jgi:hypothetical protein
MAARLSALRAGRTLAQGLFFLRFLVLISVRGWVDPRAIVRPEGLGKFEKIQLIGTRSRDLPACSIVPQPLRYSVLRTGCRICTPKRNEITGCYIKFHIEELHYLYSSTNITRITSSRMGWAGHIAQMGRSGMHKDLWWGSQKERDH